MLSTHGIEGRPAPDLRVPLWLNGEGVQSLSAVEESYVYLIAFQSWCPGCHSHGLPALAAVRAGLDAAGRATEVLFVAVQTAFEGFEENTPEAASRTMAEHNLSDVALGHDAGELPVTMRDYRTGGTPWTVLIGPRPGRTVLFNDFHAEPSALLSTITGPTEPARA